jgi:hypothetical protein
MADTSDSVKQIKASVLELADSSGNRDAFVLQWNTLIDQSLASLDAAQAQADKYLAMDKVAFGFAEEERKASETGLGSVNDTYSKLSEQFAAHGTGGHDIKSVLGTFSGMKGGPYCATVVANNRAARMLYNVEVMERDKLTRERDRKTLLDLKI